MSGFSLKYGKDSDNRLLFYYAGHGYTRTMTTGEELGYLVMVNAPLPNQDPVGLSLSSVDMQSLVTQAKIIHARHVLFMFDSCFSGSIINMRESIVPESISDNLLLPAEQTKPYRIKVSLNRHFWISLKGVKKNPLRIIILSVKSSVYI
jgi:hypothetical protein